MQNFIHLEYWENKAFQHFFSVIIDQCMTCVASSFKGKTIILLSVISVICSDVLLAWCELCDY